MHEKWRISIFLFVISIALIAAAFGWSMATDANIPYQDPTPAQQSHYLFHMRIVECLFITGVVSLIAAVFSVPVVIARTRLARRRMA